MSLFKSLLITIAIFIFIGLFCVIGVFFDQEKKSEKTLALVKDLYNKGSYEEVIAKVNETLPFAHREELLFTKFESLMELGKFYEAETLSKELLKLNAKNDKCYYLLGLLYYNTGDFTKSSESFKKAIELQPKNIDYKLNLARILAQNGNYDDAIKVYAQIMKEDQRYEVAWAEMANTYNTIGNKKEVLRLRKDAVKRFPNNSYDHYMLGVIYDELKMKKQAIISFKKSIDLQPDADTDAKDRLEKLTGKSYSVTFGSQERIPYHGMGNLMLINTKVNNVKGTFLVDTGAMTTVLYSRFLKNNNIKLITNSFGVIEMANGKKSFAPSTYIDVQMGSKNLTDIRAYILPDTKNMNIDGIIGMNVLNNFSFQIDSGKNSILINK
ncbi:MAG: tetratricopeptide repeat protein [bacterium]